MVKEKEIIKITTKKKETKKKKPSVLNVTQDIIDVNKTLTERVELNAQRIDTLSKGMDDIKNLLDRVATRMGLE
tara:strand:- start:37 stop:258 length:222 start_codon:yes stop_codon:yes gene_type:complete